MCGDDDVCDVYLYYNTSMEGGTRYKFTREYSIVIVFEFIHIVTITLYINIQ